MRKTHKILNSFKYESVDAKIDLCLSLPLSERYRQIVDAGEFLKLANRKESFLDARRTFKTVQILKQK